MRQTQEPTLRDAYRPPAHLVRSVELTFELDAKHTRVLSRLEIERASDAPAGAPLTLQGRNCTLERLALDGRALQTGDYALADETLEIPNVPDACRVEIGTALDPSANPTQMGLFLAGDVIATQCEADGFRRFTYFPDRPDVLSRYRVKLIADASAYPVLLSNGDLIEQGALPNGKHYAIWNDPYPKPSYLFAVIAGRLKALRDTHTTKRGRAISLALYAAPEQIGDCTFAMGALKRALEWDERVYGLEYDLACYNVVALEGYVGAMENKGLNVFEAKGILSNPAYTTDNEYLVLERILGHEVFHNWTGNRVTCRDWFELCLKEGLTRFRDRQFSEAMSAAGPKRIDAVALLKRNQFPEDDGNAAHAVKPDRYVDVQNLYTATVYEKGAELIRMLYVLLGHDAFHRGFARYIQRNDGRAVTTEDFIVALEAESGRDLAQFRRWWTQVGRPRIDVRGSYDAARREYRLDVSQTGAAGRPFEPMHVPIAVALFRKDGSHVPISLDRAQVTGANETVLELTEQRQTFVFAHVDAKPIPSVLRGFSAPVSLSVDLGDDELAVLAARDTDPYARWEAAQRLGIGEIRRLTKDPTAAPSRQLVAALARVLEDDATDDALRARLLQLPDEPALSDGLERVDVEGHQRARDRIRTALVDTLGDSLHATYTARSSDPERALDARAIGRRALKNACLELMMSVPSDSHRALCLAQLRSSRAMNDAFHALAFLVHVPSPERDEALELSLERWRGNRLALGQWFLAQASSRAPDAVDRVIALAQHPAFDFADSALSMALFGTFFRQNRVAFHDASGRGYEFLADVLIRVDRLRPSASYWFMPQINQWRRYDEARQRAMCAALERVAREPRLSKGLAENVAKALGRSQASMEGA